MLYQKVNGSKRYNHKHHQSIGQISKPKHHQPLQPHDDLSSDTTDEDESESISSSSSILEIAKLNYPLQQIKINRVQSSTLSTKIHSRFNITRRSTSYNPPMYYKQQTPPSNKLPIQETNTNTNTNNILSLTSSHSKSDSISKNTISDTNKSIHIDTTNEINNNNLLHILPSQHEIDSALLDENNVTNLPILRKTSDSECVRKYTSSSDISTIMPLPPPPPPPLPPLLPPPPPPPLPPSTCGQNDDRLLTWNYPYSYCSSDLFDEHKTIDIDCPIEGIINRPNLLNEMGPTLKEMKIYESDIDENEYNNNNELYNGYVTPNPIEIHNDLIRKPKLNGPLLIYRNEFNNEITTKKLGYIPIFALPIQSIVINIEISGEIAFIEMDIIFINNCSKQIKNALFVLPIINGTVTNVSACIDNNKLGENHCKKYIETFLINPNVLNNNDNDCNNNNNDSNNNNNNNNEEIKNNISDGIFDQSLDEYICDLFRFPISLINSNDYKIKICSKYHQILEYNEGRYHLKIPLQFGHNILPNNINLNKIIHINVVLNSFYGSSIKFGSNSHELNIIKTLNNYKQIYLNGEYFEHNIESIDFHIAYYYINCNKINGIGFIEKENEENGNFLIHINPITDEQYIKQSDIFGRDIIFLIDRSKSMNGSSHLKVIEALINALDKLLLISNKLDRFGMVLFNETQIYFNGIANLYDSDNDNDNDNDNNNDNDILPPKCPLFEVNKNNIEAAKQFIINYGPMGGTDIVTPLIWSLKVLNDIYINNKNNNNNNNNNSIPFVVLVTDGSDYEEKEIINNIENYCKYVRILTFGIGLNINLYFLKLLSLKSRGWNSNAIYGSDIKNKLQLLISSCYAPILKDLYIENKNIINNKHIKFNYIIKDIFINNKAIIIFGKYKNNELPQILLKTNNIIYIGGISINGQKKIYPIKMDYNNNYFTMPLKKMYLKQQLNELTSNYWYNNSNNHKKQIINLSVKYQFACEYTNLICFECNENEKQKLTNNEALPVNRNNNIINIGVTNKLFGNPDIDHNLCTIFDSVGQFINDDTYEIKSDCCCCIAIYHKLLILSSKLCCKS